jgi:hypothetical protein
MSIFIHGRFLLPSSFFFFIDPLVENSVPNFTEDDL